MFLLFRTGTNITVRILIPKATVSVSHEALGPGQVTKREWQTRSTHGRSRRLTEETNRYYYFKVVITVERD